MSDPHHKPPSSTPSDNQRGSNSEHLDRHVDGATGRPATSSTKPAGTGRKTLAEHVADVLAEQGSTTVDVGCPSELAEAYDRSGGTIKHPLERNAAVTRALARTKSGKRLFRISAKAVLYPGIVNAPINLFELRDPTGEGP